MQAAQKGYSLLYSLSYLLKSLKYPNRSSSKYKKIWSFKNSDTLHPVLVHNDGQKWVEVQWSPFQAFWCCFSLKACSSVSLSSEAARENHETAKDYVLIFLSLRHLILWKDCLNPSSTQLLCWCWLFANQHLLEKHCSGHFAQALRGCCASDVAVLTFELYDHEGMNGNDQKNCWCSFFINFSQNQIAEGYQKLIIDHWVYFELAI